MMAALAGVAGEEDKEIASKLFQAGDVNKQVEDVSQQFSFCRTPTTCDKYFKSSVLPVLPCSTTQVILFIFGKQTGQSSLMLAVSRGRMDMVEICLNIGADINAQDEVRFTVL